MDRASILIIDDDPALRRTLDDILRAKGHDTLSAGSGGEGLALVRDNPVDLVLIDLGLPDLAGIEVLNRVKTDRPATEAIILTGNATLDSAIEATNRGAFSYLLKPYDVEQLLLNIERALGKQRAEEKIVRHSTELEKNNAELKILHELSLAIGKTIDMDRLLPEVLRALTHAKIFPFDMRGAIFLVEGERLRLASFATLAEEFLAPCRTVCFDDCLCSPVTVPGEITISKDSREDRRHTVCNPAMPPHGHIIVPLKAIDKVVGVLCLYTPPEVELNEEMSSLLCSIGSQIGVGVSNTMLYEETKTSAFHDPLTGLANRRFLELQLEKLMEAARRYGNPLSVIMLDLDHFKRYNDSRGHVEGDRLLARIAAILLREVRSADYLFRYGGEEFLAILPETGPPMACEAAERLRKAVEAESGVTVSLGVASYRKTMADKESLIRRADEALYRAKENGRNRVEWADKSDEKGSL
ncbi:MAG: diguanylate cyclase [Geobacteraceae bacterium]|nr:diguanylate cyclase [Geobacteraceae bacterium]